MNIWIYVITTIIFFLFCGIILYSIKYEGFTTAKPNLFIYWEQGWDNAPFICKMCLKSWEKYNQDDWNIIKLDANNINNYIKMENIVNNFWNIKSIAHRSDLLRLNLLNKYNGVWADATTFCTKPLNTWIHPYTDFFAFNKPSNTKQMANWFLYSKRKNYIIEKMTDSLNSYWRNRNSNNNYFIFHDIFNQLYDTDAKFKEQWDGVDHISANLPHALKYKEKHEENIRDDKRAHIVNVQAPLYKLDHTDKSSNLMEHSTNNIFYFLAHHHGVI